MQLKIIPLKQRVWVNYRCRCSKCGHRKTLKRRPEHYKRPPECSICGSKKWYIDWNRMLKPDNSSGAPVCKYDCAHYPHRMNSKFCKHYDDYILTRNFNKNSKHLPDNPLGDDDKPPF